MICVECKGGFDFPVYKEHYEWLVVGSQTHASGETTTTTQKMSKFVPCCPFCGVPIYQSSNQTAKRTED